MHVLFGSTSVSKLGWIEIPFVWNKYVVKAGFKRKWVDSQGRELAHRLLAHRLLAQCCLMPPRSHHILFLEIRPINCLR